MEDPWNINAGPYEFKVPQDSYLLLGDNRNGSSDARVWEHTYVSKDDILAKAIFRYYPFNRFRSGEISCKSGYKIKIEVK